MIKKYHQFIKENTIRACTREDIEDQFLRIKEVFGADVSIYYTNVEDIHKQFWITQEVEKFLKGAKNPCIKVLITKLEPTEEAYDELNQIKNRMELMYPVKVFYEIKIAKDLDNFEFFNVFIKFN